jgi:Ribbon-helix-helix protein, copG family
VKTLTIRLPDKLATAIDTEARSRGCSKSDVVRERLQNAAPKARSPLEAIADLAGSVDGLPADLSARKKEYLKLIAYGRKRSR